MKAKTQNSFKPVVLPPPGTTVARCYSVIHIGTVPHYFNNVLQGNKEKVFVTWELPEFKAEFDASKGPQPFVISHEFVMSTKENSNFAQLIKAWRNKPFTEEERKGFDPTKMLNKTALISFQQRRKKAYANMEISTITNENTSLIFGAIMPKPESMQCPPAINPLFIWDWDPIVSGSKKFDPKEFEKIPKFLRKQIMDSEEFKKYAAHLYSETASDKPADNPPSPVETVSDNNW